MYYVKILKRKDTFHDAFLSNGVRPACTDINNYFTEEICFYPITKRIRSLFSGFFAFSLFMKLPTVL
jgi:hypothetical protein